MRRFIHSTVLAILMVVLSLVMPYQPAQSAPLRITLWHIATDTDPFRPVLQQAIDRFNAAHPDVQIDAQAVANDTFKMRLQEAIAANDHPDVFQTWGGGLLKELVDRGVVREIPELNGVYGQRFIPAGLASSTFDGRRYAIPANLAGVFLWYNDELFRTYNVELPTTWRKVIAACHAFRAAGISPIGLGNIDKWPGGLWFTYLVTRISGPEAFQRAIGQERAGAFTDPVFIEAGARIQEAVQAGCFEDGHNTTNFGDAQALLATGRAAMQLQGDWNFGGLKRIAYRERIRVVIAFSTDSVEVRRA